MRELRGYHKENAVPLLSFFCRVCMCQCLVFGFYLDANVNSKHATWIADAYSKTNISIRGEGTFARGGVFKTFFTRRNGRCFCRESPFHKIRTM